MLKSVGNALMESQRAAGRCELAPAGRCPVAVQQLEVPTRCMLAWYPPVAAAVAAPAAASGCGGEPVAAGAAAALAEPALSGYRPHRDNVSRSFMDDDGGWTADREQADR